MSVIYIASFLISLLPLEICVFLWYFKRQLWFYWLGHIYFFFFGFSFICNGYLFTMCYVYLVTQSCPTLCNPLDCSPPGSSVHGILQERILEWIAISSSRGILPTQGLNLSLLCFLYCRQILYLLRCPERKYLDYYFWVWCSKF